MSEELTTEIADTIGKMLKNTSEKLEQDKGEWLPPKNLAAASLTPVYNYCHAILLLAENEQELPAMALLRVLGEFSIRLIWCYESEEHGSDASTRIERWYKYSLHERKKAMEKWLPLLNESDPTFAKEVESRIRHAQEVMSVIPEPLAPSLAKCVETLHPAAKMVFPLLYTRYMHAVHIDAELLSQLMRPSDAGICFSGDTEVLTALDLKCRSLFAAFTIVTTIWNHFGWDWTEWAAQVFAIIEKCDLPQEVDISAACNAVLHSADKEKEKRTEDK